MEGSQSQKIEQYNTNDDNVSQERMSRSPCTAYIINNGNLMEAKNEEQITMIANSQLRSSSINQKSMQGDSLTLIHKVNRRVPTVEKTY